LKFCKVILGACALAAVIQMILPPDVPLQRKVSLRPVQINLEMEAAAVGHGRPELHYAEENVNAYLDYVLRSKRASFGTIAPLERVFVRFEEGLCRVNVERSVLHYSLYGGSYYQVRIDGGKLVVSNQGGNLGRLPIHSLIMKYGDIIFYRTWAALERDRKNVLKMERIEFHPQSVTLFTKAH
jgi:hypothetical protein